MIDIVIVDYGIGNIKSIQRGFLEIGKKTKLSADPTIISKAGLLVFPGVGSFGSGITHLHKFGVKEAIYDFVGKGNPFLGICLGMQLLLDSSTEHGRHKGLGLIPGFVDIIPMKSHTDKVRKIPHIGWSALTVNECQQDWKNSCLKNINQGDYVYFVHSYMAMIKEKKYLLSQCKDEGLLIPAAIKKENITGLQFHPEKSGRVGLQILNDFISN